MWHSTMRVLPDHKSADSVRSSPVRLNAHLWLMRRMIGGRGRLESSGKHTRIATSPSLDSWKPTGWREKNLNMAAQLLPATRNQGDINCLLLRVAYYSSPCSDRYESISRFFLCLQANCKLVPIVDEPRRFSYASFFTLTIQVYICNTISICPSITIRLQT